mgnify:CR=1 FL=1
MTSTNNDINIQLSYLNNKIEDIKSIFSKNLNDNSKKIELLSELSNINQNNIYTIQSNLNFYDKTESDNIFATKNELINSVSLDNYYSKTEINSNIDITQQNKIEISKSLIPKNNLEINLGSIDKKFKELYLSGNTLHLGDQEIKSTLGGIEINKLIISDSNFKILENNKNIELINNEKNYTNLKNKIENNINNINEINNQIEEIKNKLNI